MLLKRSIIIAPLGLLSLSVLSGAFLISSYSSATTASTATATVKVAASCTLTTSGGGNYSTTVPNGTSAEIAGSTMSVSCNDAGGFALYAVGYSDDTVGNNNMIGTSTNIPTNTSGTNSYWAMKINPTSGTTPTIENSFNNYHIVPNAHTKVASYSQSTGTGSLSVNATYKANISSTQLAGNYLGKVKYTLVHPANEVPPHEVACEAGKICYNANTNIVEGQMGKQTPTSTELTDGITLYAPNFKRDGYGFAGWSDKYDYETNPDAHFYGPQETITAPNNISNDGLSLYAIWIKSAGFMQNQETVESICNSLAESGPDMTKTLNSVSALTDNRDDDTYAIAKLADGNCWMVENLRLDNIPALSTENTNNPLLPLVNNYNNMGMSNHLSIPSNEIQSEWCSVSTNDCFFRSNLDTMNTTDFINNNESNYDTGNSVYSYGNYYNWYSVATEHSRNSTGEYYNSPGDICPKGWHVPTNGAVTSDYYILNSIVNLESTIADAGLRAYPNNMVYSGNRGANTYSSRGKHGDYWSSTSFAVGVAYLFSFGTWRVYPGIHASLTTGYTIQCVYNNSDL